MRLLPLILAAALGCLSPVAQAGPVARLDAGVHRLLDDDAGWVLHQEHGAKGITVYRKEIPALGLTAFKGVKTLDPRVRPDRLFAVICDIDTQKRFSDLLLESRVVQRTGGELAYYQVIEPPPLVPGSERFWVNTGVVSTDVGGEPGHLKRAWSVAPEGMLAGLHAELRGRYPKAIEVEVTHGSWEIDPMPDGSHRYIYRTVSHPGGKVPLNVARMLSSRALPDNMLDFERAALR